MLDRRYPAQGDGTRAGGRQSAEGQAGDPGGPGAAHGAKADAPPACPACEGKGRIELDFSCGAALRICCLACGGIGVIPSHFVRAGWIKHQFKADNDIQAHEAAGCSICRAIAGMWSVTKEKAN